MVKINSGCPGQNTAYLKDFNTSLVPCPNCGNELEFFADEKKVICSKCQTRVFRINPDIVSYKNGALLLNDQDSSCLDWCGGCLEARDYNDIAENKKRLEQKKSDFKKLIDSIDPKDNEAIDFFIDAFKKSINYKKLVNVKIFEILRKNNPKLFRRVRNYYLNCFK